MPSRTRVTIGDQTILVEGDVTDVVNQLESGQPYRGAKVDFEGVTVLITPALAWAEFEEAEEFDASKAIY